MKHVFFPFLAAVSCFPCAALAEEILLNSVETSERVVAYHMDDLGNSGEVFGDPAGKTYRVDTDPIATMQIGDVGNAEMSGRVRKNFLLFHLPALKGRKLAGATLRVFFVRSQQDAADKPLPPARLLHAKDWLDETWSSDPLWHGLQTVHFGDMEIFSDQLPLCEPGVPPGFVELDVAAMIESDYRRNPEPVAAFRLEVSAPETLTIADDLYNSYVFIGSGQAQRQADKVPTLILSLE